MHEFTHLMFDFRHVSCVIAFNRDRPPSNSWQKYFVASDSCIYLILFCCLSSSEFIIFNIMISLEVIAIHK